MLSFIKILLELPKNDFRGILRREKNEVIYEIYKKNEKLRTILSTYNKGRYLIKHSTTIVVFPILNQVISLY